MDKVIAILSRIEVIIAILVLIAILLVYFVVHKSTLKKYKKELNALEVRYNKIKSVPLAFKLNKAVAISKVDSKMSEAVGHAKDDFDQAQANLRQISESLGNIDDNIVMGKTKLVKAGLLDVESSISLGEEQITKLEAFLDTVLEKETSQRAEATALKEKFRLLKQDAQDKSNLISFSWPAIELKISDLEKKFSAFEEWMYASDFEKATEVLEEIKVDIDDLQNCILELPKLLQLAKYTIPDFVKEVNKLNMTLKNKGVVVSHLETESNLNALAKSLKDDMEDIRTLNLTDIGEHLVEYQTRLKQLDTQLRKEGVAFEDMSRVSAELSKLLDDTKHNVNFISREYEKASVRFGIENLDQVVEDAYDKINEINAHKAEVIDEIKNNILPPSTAYDKLVALKDEASKLHDEIREHKEVLSTAMGDEERANKQLLKLQLILNEMQVKIRMNRLPSISASYEEDQKKANDYIVSIRKLINETPLNVKLLNTTLNDAIDFTYKLWNNVNNIVGTAIMVENTIVFGNKYRSTYPDIDSELTHAELCFRNGQYTQALKIAIATIEKIHPGTYEKLIKENSQSA